MVAPAYWSPRAGVEVGGMSTHKHIDIDMCVFLQGRAKARPVHVTKAQQDPRRSLLELSLWTASSGPNKSYDHDPEICDHDPELCDHDSELKSPSIGTDEHAQPGEAGLKVFKGALR
eukprot:5755-Pelagomonas_calceolata.AAC.3